MVVVYSKRLRRRQLADGTDAALSLKQCFVISRRNSIPPTQPAFPTLSCRWRIFEVIAAPCSASPLRIFRPPPLCLFFVPSFVRPVVAGSIGPLAIPTMRLAPIPRLGVFVEGFQGLGGATVTAQLAGRGIFYHVSTSPSDWSVDVPRGVASAAGASRYFTSYASAHSASIASRSGLLSSASLSDRFSAAAVSLS